MLFISLIFCPLNPELAGKEREGRMRAPVWLVSKARRGRAPSIFILWFQITVYISICTLVLLTFLNTTKHKNYNVTNIVTDSYLTLYPWVRRDRWLDCYVCFLFWLIAVFNLCDKCVILWLLCTMLFCSHLCRILSLLFFQKLFFFFMSSWHFWGQSFWWQNALWSVFSHQQNLDILKVVLQ